MGQPSELVFSGPKRFLGHWTSSFETGIIPGKPRRVGYTMTISQEAEGKKIMGVVSSSLCHGVFFSLLAGNEGWNLSSITQMKDY